MDNQMVPSFYNRLAVVVSVIALCISVFATLGHRVPNAPVKSGVGTEGTMVKVRAGGVIRAGYVPYPPTVTEDPATGKVSGFMIDVMDRIAQDGGFKVEYEAATWANMITGLKTGKYDIIVAVAFRTIPRAKEVTFTPPLMYWGMSAVTKAGDMRIKTVEDLSKPGLRIAVTNGTAEYEFVTKRLLKAVPVVTSGTDVSKGMLEVISGRADVAITDSSTCAKFATAHAEVRNVFAGNPFEVYGASFVVRTDDREFSDFIGTAIDVLKVSGETDIIKRRYGKDADWLVPQRPWQINAVSP